MPIKVRCEGCETVLNVSDQAAGKAVKCKQCGGRVRVPMPKGAKASAKPKAEELPEDPDDLFGGAGLRSTEDTKRKVCPGCAAPVHQDDIECPKCGVTIATGGLSDKQRRRKERKGPPPEEFYASVWGNSWKFLKRHWSYAVRTAVIWSITLSMSLTCLYSLDFYTSHRIASLREMAAGNAAIRIEGNYLYIDVPKEGGSQVQYDGTYYTTAGVKVTLYAPHIQAWQEPPSLFWIAMTIVFQLGFGGWAWSLATIIAGLTMEGGATIKRFQNDFFGNLTMGFRFYFWPIVLTLPVLVVAAGIAPFSPIAAAIVAGSAMLFPLLVLPAAVVHMAQKYSYRAWLPTWMAHDFGKTIAPSLYIFAMNFFLVLLVPVGIAVALAVMWRQASGWALGQEAAILAWLKANVNDFGEGNIEYLFYRLPLVFTSLFLFFVVLCSLISFPTIFMMRVIGLYGVYFRTDLAIVNEFPDLEPAGFGPRYLAFVIDSIIMLLLGGIGFAAGTLFGLLFQFYGWSFADMAAYGIAAVASLLLWGNYFALGESGAARATLGKWSLGMIVLREDGKPQTRKQAFGRAASALLSALTLCIGFLMCFSRADKKAMHDLMSKSKVVWQGEQT